VPSTGRASGTPSSVASTSDRDGREGRLGSSAARPGGRHRGARVAAAVALAAGSLGLSLAACGSDPAPPEAPATTVPGGDVAVELHDNMISEPHLEVPVGASVRWENLDPSEHELVSLSGDVIRSPVLGQAASYTAQFEAPGEYQYYCNIHNYMKGTVVVG
jgi:plastocyanin